MDSTSTAVRVNSLSRPVISSLGGMVTVNVNSLLELDRLNDIGPGISSPTGRDNSKELRVTEKTIWLMGSNVSSEAKLHTQDLGHRVSTFFT